MKNFPELLLEWDYDKNEKPPSDYYWGSNKVTWWKCEHGHSYDMKICNKTISENKCPFCRGLRVCHENSLAFRQPELSNEWHESKNGNLTASDVTCGSEKSVWWRGACGHEWEAIIVNRVKNRGCPYCSGRTIHIDNCLVTKFPEVAKEWSFTKNSLTPYEVIAKSNKSVWWLGKCGHEWQATVGSRTGKHKTGCPYCSGQKVCIDNCLATRYPELAKEWHPTKNGNLTPFDITGHSARRKYWWQCKEGHDWESTANNRHNRSCPICSESNGEKHVRSILEDTFTDFISQYEFKDLLGIKGNPLRFDFAVFDNANLLFLIEYDGEFHFNKMYDGDGHEIIVEHDRRKDEYCNQNNISLLRIPHWEYENSHEIILNFSQKLKSHTIS